MSIDADRLRSTDGLPSKPDVTLEGSLAGIAGVLAGGDIPAGMNVSGDTALMARIVEALGP